MKILIGYNGSEASTAALNDLRHAGLPAGTVALLAVIAEGQVTPKIIAEAEHLSSKGTAILRQNFTDWTVASEAAAGIPAAKLLDLAESFNPDLIVIGEPRHALKTGVLIGNTSHAMLTGARCSVRISRGVAKDAPHPERIVVGFDGSPGSTRAVDSIASRSWAVDTDVRLLSVADSSVLEAIGRFKPQMANASAQTKFASQWAQSLAASSKASLTNAGIRSSVELRLGDAKDVIVAEAENWNADTIFVGPHCAGDSFQRFLLGSVSASVAARAHCSVEVVRC